MMSPRGTLQNSYMDENAFFSHKNLNFLVQRVIFELIKLVYYFY